MQAPSLPLDETRRLEILSALGLVDTPAEERFDRITRVTQRLFGVRASTISLVDATRSWFKSTMGLPLTQLARQVSFCGHAVADDGVVVVNDAREDRRFHDNPLVIHEPRIRFYAGHPVRSPEGIVVGVISIYDSEPREFTRTERDLLADLAAMTETEIRATDMTAAIGEVMKQQRTSGESSRIDSLTRLWNRSAALDILERELEHANGNQSPLGILLIDVDRLARVNQEHGHTAGDALLTDIARVLRSSLRPYDSIARFAGEEFLVLLPAVDAEQARIAADRLRVAVSSEPRLAAHSATISIGGATTLSAKGRVQKEHLLRAAEAALWEAKKTGGDAASIAPTLP